MVVVISLVNALAASSGDFGWKGWPFSGFGYEGGIWPVVARFFFVALILVAIALFLRLLYGPKGWFRGNDWETIQEAKKREQESEDKSTDKGERK